MLARGLCRYQVRMLDTDISVYIGLVYIGQRVAMLARGLTRYQVRMLDTGKKILVRHALLSADLL